MMLSVKAKLKSLELAREFDSERRAGKNYTVLMSKLFDFHDSKPPAISMTR
jgi:hypothetical protein